VVDGSKALRKAIDAVYGVHNPVQRCRSHKLRYLPRELPGQTAAAMRAAWRGRRRCRPHRSVFGTRSMETAQALVAELKAKAAAAPAGRPKQE